MSPASRTSPWTNSTAALTQPRKVELRAAAAQVVEADDVPILMPRGKSERHVCTDESSAARDQDSHEREIGPGRRTIATTSERFARDCAVRSAANRRSSRSGSRRSTKSPRRLQCTSHVNRVTLSRLAPGSRPYPPWPARSHPRRSRPAASLRLIIGWISWLEGNARRSALGDAADRPSLAEKRMTAQDVRRERPVMRTVPPAPARTRPTRRPGCTCSRTAASDRGQSCRSVGCRRPAA